MENYSLSDIAAVSGNDMHGGSWWIIVLFLLVFGGGGMFGWNRGGEQIATNASLQRGFDTAEIFDKLNGLENGLCSGFYDQNTTMLQGFGNITNAITTLGYQNQQCCCETNRNIDAVRYENAKNTCDIVNAIHADGEATRALINENTIQALRDKVADLQLAQSQCAQNAYLVNTLRPYPTPAYAVANPYCGYGFNVNPCYNV